MSIVQVFMCLVLLMTVLPEGKGWRGIVPLHSTRVDVERLLGSPSETNGHSSVYKLKNENVIVHYSDEPCRADREGGWNVPRDTVVRITLAPKTVRHFSDLQLDEKYKKTVSGDATSFVLYVNEEEGIAYEVHEEAGQVVATYYEPAASDSRLRCPVTTAKKPCGSSQKN